MIDVNKLKVGVAFEEDNQPWRVLKYDFTKMGRGNATIKIKARNLVTGAIVTKSYISGSRVDSISLEKKHLQYLYEDGEKLYFMDPISFEQSELAKEIVGNDTEYLIAGDKVWVLFWDDKVLGVDLPAAVIMKVVEAEPAVKGNSVSNVFKEAILESGKKVQVPLFIKPGDEIKINTETGSYIARA